MWKIKYTYKIADNENTQVKSARITFQMFSTWAYLLSTTGLKSGQINKRVCDKSVAVEGRPPKQQQLCVYTIPQDNISIYFQKPCRLQHITIITCIKNTVVFSSSSVSNLDIVILVRNVLYCFLRVLMMCMCKFVIHHQAHKHLSQKWSNVRNDKSDAVEGKHQKTKATYLLFFKLALDLHS